VLPLPKRERVGVRGFDRLLVDGVQNFFEHAVEILKNLVIPET
jgi:hypothetical protein